ncbi:MAG: ketoacyl-ACP synthase III, partial [Actinobacteria bacterium]|nr:ketoacyl-ACP synthase III [Actinomycetota bacterium]
MKAAVAGCGVGLPDGRLTNADLEARLDTSDVWIAERTGIRERRIVAEGEDTRTLAVAAGAAAIKDADLTPDDIDLVLVATCTPSQLLPSTASLVQNDLGVRGGAFDLGAACAGFVYAFVAASALVETSAVGAVLVIGAERLSAITDPDDRGTAILFGDGAGACVVTAADDSREVGLLGSDLGCDGSAAELLEIPLGRTFIEMDGPAVFKRAVRVLVDSSYAALGRAGLAPADVDLFVPHQANARIIAAANERLGIPVERTMVNIDRYGNTSAASIPIALAEAAEAGRISDGDLVLMSGFGAGMTWASAVMRWG